MQLFKLKYLYKPEMVPDSQKEEIGVIPDYAFPAYPEWYKRNINYVYINPESISKVSPIAYRVLKKLRYYMFYVQLYNNDVYWINTKDMNTYYQVDRFFMKNPEYTDNTKHLNKKK